MNLNRICFYHASDWDGKASAALINMYFEGDVTFLGLDHGIEFPFHLINEEVEVYMVDFSIKPEGMKRIIESSKKFVWIDHHISAFKAMEEAGITDVPGLQRVGEAGVELTWKYLYPALDILPSWVTYLGRFDVWDKNHPDWETKIKPFQYGFDEVNPHIKDINFWRNELDLDKINTIITDGAVVMEKRKKELDEKARKFSFEMEFEGLQFVALETFNRSSESLLAVYDPEKHDAMMAYHEDGDFYRFGMYTTRDDLDLSVVAKKMGGGGHKQAAGFERKTLPFVKPSKE